MTSRKNRKATTPLAARAARERWGDDSVIAITQCVLEKRFVYR